jgi:phage gp46-like protein
MSLQHTSHVWGLAGSGTPSRLDPYTVVREERTPPLVQAVVASLFTWRAAEEEDLPTDDGRCRGWWADALADGPLGSRLWTLERAKVTAATVVRARQLAEEALDWMVAEGLATSVDVTAERRGIDAIALGVRVLRDERVLAELLFANLWEVLR